MASKRERELDAALDEALDLLDQMGDCLWGALQSLENEGYEDQQRTLYVRGYPPLPDPKEETEAVLSILADDGELRRLIEHVRALRERQRAIQSQAAKDRAEKARQDAAKHRTMEYYASAYDDLYADKGKVPGRRKLNDCAWKLAKAGALPDDCLNEFTEHRARAFLKTR